MNIPNMQKLLQALRDPEEFPNIQYHPNFLRISRSQIKEMDHVKDAFQGVPRKIKHFCDIAGFACAVFIRDYPDMVNLPPEMVEEEKLKYHFSHRTAMLWLGLTLEEAHALFFANCPTRESAINAIENLWAQ